MAIPELLQLQQSIEELVDAKITDRFANHPIHVDVQTVSFEQFERSYMAGLDGYEHIDHVFFRKFLRWMEQYYAYHLEEDANVIRAGMTVAHITTGIYTAPDDTEYEGLEPILDELFERISEIDLTSLDGRVTTLEDNYGLINSAISEIQGDISDIEEAMSGYSGSLSAHVNESAIHLTPDGSGIVANGLYLSLSDSYIRGLFSALAPIINTAGVLSLDIDEATLDIVDGKLTVIGGGGGGTSYGLAYDTGTHILSIVAGGGSSDVDLSSLLSGSVDLSNYLKKTGATTQTIQGNIIVTGTITAGGEITGYGS